MQRPLTTGTAGSIRAMAAVPAAITRTTAAAVAEEDAEEREAMAGNLTAEAALGEGKRHWSNLLLVNRHLNVVS